MKWATSIQKQTNIFKLSINVIVSLSWCSLGALCARLLIYELQKDVVKLRLPDTLNIVHRSNQKKKTTSQSVGVSVCFFSSYCLFAVSTEPILWPNWAEQHLIRRNNATKKERETRKIHTQNKTYKKSVRYLIDLFHSMQWFMFIMKVNALCTPAVRFVIANLASSFFFASFAYILYFSLFL